MPLSFTLFRLLRGVPPLMHGFTRRGEIDGLPLSVSFRACPSREVVVAHREEVALWLGSTLSRFVFAEQVHEAAVAVVGEKDAGRGALEPETAIPGVDALITRERGLFLAGLSADCPMVFLADPKGGAIGLVHSSWRSTARDVCGATVRAMHDAFGTRPEDLYAGISPSIGRCCFEVKEDFVQQSGFGRAYHEGLYTRSEGRMTFDLWTTIHGQLFNVGVHRKRIEWSLLCTCCRGDLFYSHRREGAGCGRMMSAIGWQA